MCRWVLTSHFLFGLGNLTQPIEKLSWNCLGGCEQLPAAIFKLASLNLPGFLPQSVMQLVVRFFCVHPHCLCLCLSQLAGFKYTLFQAWQISPVNFMFIFLLMKDRQHTSVSYDLSDWSGWRNPKPWILNLWFVNFDLILCWLGWWVGVVEGHVLEGCSGGAHSSSVQPRHHWSFCVGESALCSMSHGSSYDRL